MMSDSAQIQTVIKTKYTGCNNGRKRQHIPLHSNFAALLLATLPKIWMALICCDLASITQIMEAEQKSKYRPFRLALVNDILN